VIEDAAASASEREIIETNAGAYCFDASWLWPRLEGLQVGPQGEAYLTALIGLAVADGRRVEGYRVQDADEAIGVNDRVQLAQAEAVLRNRIRRHWMREGVTLIDPASTYIDDLVEIGRDTVVHPNTHLLGNTRIGSNCIIGPNSIVSDSVIGENCLIQASVVETATLEDDVTVGPFSHLRPDTHLERRVHVGNFAEIKNSRVGADTLMGHFSYVGDATLGREVNVGAGTITCNFDGIEKHRTVVGDEVFIGSDTLLIAPVQVGDRAATGAGAVVTQDIPPETLAVGVPARHRPRPQ
jgi:bifunctional UDP-N-acetylglucosamine pyrophosphorylase/glucosamine-1-phosphate N-acetyltransferase